MPKQINRLNAHAIRNAKPGLKGSKLYPDGLGLYLQVTRTGVKSFIFRYARNGKTHLVGLGPEHTFTLAEARKKALKIRKKLLDGESPTFKSRVSVHQVKTFRKCAEEYVPSLKIKHRSDKAHAQWLSSLQTYAFPVIGDVPVNDITVHMIRDMLTRDDLWEKKHVTASRVRGRTEQVLDWATVLEYRSGDNPARYKNYLSTVLPLPNKTARGAKHHPALPHAQMGTFCRTLRSQPESVSRLALEFLILTAARTGEVIGATWDEIDIDEGIWTIEASRMKSNRQHRVPLTQPALAILDTLRRHRESDYIFLGMKHNQHISNMSLLQYMRGMRERGLLLVNAVPHGFRSSFRSWAADLTTVPREIAEMCLAHVVGSTVENSYQRSDVLNRRRELMEGWAKYCAA